MNEEQFNEFITNKLSELRAAIAPFNGTSQASQEVFDAFNKTFDFVETTHREYMEAVDEDEKEILKRDITSMMTTLAAVGRLAKTTFEMMMKENSGLEIGND